ncbi:hypothetical protein SBA1_50030 [Candidatus Sulfotelmatobacter kueseliae]|uniref:Uncharacterized protein n=1 Tax=Candidatus Sulfotelmatobacter kueseliae TaxID=2042962 RepID=A0A2U3KVA1_9BACT|nr:hypothetical protein SBA1_50030 [Candidatus Sulfotelmatobacter kueseliae]
MVQNPPNVEGVAPGYSSGGHLTYRRVAGRTSPIVRPWVTNRMVTKGYRKGVYERLPAEGDAASGKF